MLAEEGLILLGDDFLPWIVLAFGAAMVVGNVLAILRPPGVNQAETSEQPAKPPIMRALVMIVIGLIAAGWGLASLVN